MKNMSKGVLSSFDDLSSEDQQLMLKALQTVAAKKKAASNSADYDSLSGTDRDNDLVSDENSDEMKSRQKKGKKERKRKKDGKSKGQKRGRSSKTSDRPAKRKKENQGKPQRPVEPRAPAKRSKTKRKSMAAIEQEPMAATKKSKVHAKTYSCTDSDFKLIKEAIQVILFFC
jgi:hypothetical protein